MDIISLIFV
jgi:sedoheptulose-bisphosphatase